MMMSQDIEATLSKAFVGRTCNVIRREFDWVLFFEAHRALVLTTPWRIVANGQIAYTDADDGQRFGHPAPIDGAARANHLISGLAVSQVHVHPEFADLTLLFAEGVAIEVFNHSSGYEAWQAEFSDGDGERTIIGLGGGGFAVSSGPNQIVDP